MPSKFDKIQKITQILYSMRPEIGKYCWDVTIFQGKEETEKPQKVIESYVEIEEERTLKVTDGLDQMHIEDDDEGNEEEEYIDLIPVPDLEEISEDRTEKPKTQSKITSFFTAK